MNVDQRVLLIAGLGLATVVAVTVSSGSGRSEAGPGDRYTARLPLLLRGAAFTAPEPTAAPTLTPPPADGLAIIAQLGGTARDVAAANGYAYVAQGSGLTVYDVRDPAAPRPVGRVAPLGGVPVGVDVTSGNAYVTTQAYDGMVGTAGLTVVEVSDPVGSRVVGQLDYGTGLGDVVVADGYAYVAPTLEDERRWLRVLDLADPARPREVGHVELSLAPRRLGIEGSRLYAGLDVVDVADPTNPRIMEPFVPEGLRVYPSDVAPAGELVAFTSSGMNYVNNWVYLRRSGHGTTPAIVTELELDPGIDALGIARVAERFLVVGMEGGGVFDAPADGSAPTVSRFTAPGRDTAVAVNGRMAYVAANPDWSFGTTDVFMTFGGGLQTLDLTDATAPRVLATVAGPAGYTTAAAGVGDRLYVTDGASNGQAVPRFWVLDAHSPPAAAPIGMAPLDEAATGGMAVEGDLVYLTTYNSLEVWDVTVPTAPRRVGAADAFWSVGERPPRVFKHGDFAYVMSEHELFTLNVADPTQPYVIEPTGGDDADDFVAGPGDIGYRLDQDSLQAVRLGAGRPQPVGPALKTFDYGRLAVGGTTVYVIEDDLLPPGRLPELQVIDAADPANLCLIATLPRTLPSTGFHQLVVAGDRLYAGSPTELIAWDISDPFAPTPRGRILLPNYARAATGESGRIALSAWGDRAVVAQEVDGITVVAPTR